MSHTIPDVTEIFFTKQNNVLASAPLTNILSNPVFTKSAKVHCKNKQISSSKTKKSSQMLRGKLCNTCTLI